MKTMKKKNQRGFTHHLALIVVGVLVLGAVGFAGWRVYSSKNNDAAKASAWQPIGNSGNGLVINACRVSGSTTQGKVYLSNMTPRTATFRGPWGNITVASKTGSIWKSISQGQGTMGFTSVAAESVIVGSVNVKGLTKIC